MTEPPKDISATKDFLAELFSQHEKVALAFSGGKDSLVLLDLCRPFKSQITVTWSNTGAMFPHMVDFVRNAVEGFTFVELRTDQAAYIATFGLPSDLVPAEHLAGRKYTNPDGSRTLQSPAIQSYGACCFALRTQPAINLAQLIGATVIVGGDRYADHTCYGEGQFPSGSPYLPLESVWPLAHWTEDDVMAHLEEHAIELPEQYAFGCTSLECWNCTAYLSPERIAYMKARHPELMEELKQRVAAVQFAIHRTQQKMDGWVRPLFASEGEPNDD